MWKQTFFSMHFQKHYKNTMRSNSKLNLGDPYKKLNNKGIFCVRPSSFQGKSAVGLSIHHIGRGVWTYVTGLLPYVQQKKPCEELR